MTTPGLLKLADELEDRYWEELFQVFKEKADQLFRKHPIMSYIYDNYFEEGPSHYSLELDIGTLPEDAVVNRGKPSLSKEQLKELIVSLGQEFKKEFPTAQFLVSDIKDGGPPSFGGEKFAPPDSDSTIKQLKITVNKDSVKVK